MIPSPMLACPLDIDRVHAKALGYYMEPKLDGWRCLVVVTDGEPMLLSRTLKEFTHKVPDFLLEQFVSLGDNYILDGELGYGADDSEGFFLMTNEHYHMTASVLGSAPDEARRKWNELWDKGWRMHYVAFDLLQAGGYSLLETPQGVRYDALYSLIGDGHRKGDLLEVTMTNRFVDGWDEETYNRLVQDGAEGIMLKNPEQTYKPGKRPANHWFKVKKYDTMDVIISGFEWGQGKYEGQIGAVLFSLWDSDRQGPGEPVGKCSGMDDGLRQMMTTGWHHYVGKVMEIKYFGKVGKDVVGLRHPNFVRLRPDKDAHDCTLD